MDEKERDMKIIRGISKISLHNICNMLNIPFQNVWSGKASSENIRKVREKIESEVAKLYVN